jgi:hypothetical protein
MIAARFCGNHGEDEEAREDTRTRSSGALAWRGADMPPMLEELEELKLLVVTFVL